VKRTGRLSLLSNFRWTTQIDGSVRITSIHVRLEVLKTVNIKGYSLAVCEAEDGGSGLFRKLVLIYQTARCLIPENVIEYSYFVI
jgi:hypothetical protein